MGGGVWKKWKKIKHPDSKIIGKEKGGQETLDGERINSKGN